MRVNLFIVGVPKWRTTNIRRMPSFPILTTKPKHYVSICHIIIIIIIFWEFFPPALADGFSLMFEWRQLSSSLQLLSLYAYFLNIEWMQLKSKIKERAEKEVYIYIYIYMCVCVCVYVCVCMKRILNKPQTYTIQGWCIA